MAEQEESLSLTQTIDYETILGVPGEARKTHWEQEAARSFERRMLDRSDLFPCVFGVDAVRRATLRYCFVPLEGRADTLRRGLKEFAEKCYDLGKRTSLVTFFEPDLELNEIDDYRREFWNLLASLMEADDQPWPQGIDRDTESPSWEFSCFGVPFFVVANTPRHLARRSRYFEYFSITFQPRFVFDDLGPDTTTGKNSRKVIRNRLADYDTVAPFSGLGNFGDADNREWIQYFLPDDSEAAPEPAKCPLAHEERTRLMTGPDFASVKPADLSPELLDLLPEQGSIELQHDQPGKLFAWHKHSLDEELYILSGEVILFWADADGSYNERHCGPGTRIALPAGTLHGSVAGPAGAQYVIRPESGQTAVTTFLPESDWPHPVATEPSK